MHDPRTLKQKVLARWQALKSERASWDPHWRELAEMYSPRLGAFALNGKQNRGEARNERIIDNTATRAAKVLRSCLMAGGSSPARPWIRFQMADPDLNRRHEVKAWCAEATERVLRAYAKSNTYGAFHQLYGEIAIFGTGADIVVPDFETVIHHYPLTVGQYALAQDAKGRVCTLYREYQMTVSEMVKEFGLENCSDPVREAYQRGNLDSWFTVVHAIEPRADRKLGKLNARNKAWQSVYLEPGAADRNDERVLRVSGFDEFPALCPRWDLTPGDIYGGSPGMEALGDVHQLQHQQRRKGQAIDYKTLPALQAPTSLKNHEGDIVAGGVTFTDAATSQHGIRPMWEVGLDLSDLLEDMQDVRRRIDESFHSDLILMMQNDDRSNVTAREIAERHEEKLMILGPVLDRLTKELWEPCADRTFKRMLEAGAMPPIPEVMLGEDLNVEFVSMLAQAQKAVGIASTDRFIASLGQIKEVKPEVLDRLDADGIVDVYADSIGADPRMMVPVERANETRRARNAAHAAKEQLAGMESIAASTQALTNSPIGGEPTAFDALANLQGYGRGAA